ncbi:protein brambleberry-like [Euwallacea similis]|uniref:protein brambleberry-like n=1 Tax=Euwallacea similis TaxID=1736056 RepID=UPI00344C8B66
MNFVCLFAILSFLDAYYVQANLQDYIKGIASYFSPSNSGKQDELYGSEYTQNIPYEVSTLDEKFISEAVKLTGVAISELDSCQQRVVLKLRSDCNKMNDEQLAKMAVQLLNCQSYVEGRKTYPCNEEMSIKKCTQEMDSDTWTSYHLMSNRARAVCYMVRQSQFRGLAEHTVNRLMEASKDQLKSLGRIAANQESIFSLAENTYDSLSRAQKELSKQQKDMQQAQLHGQMVVESNIMRLVDEKRLIHETHNKLIQMTQEVQDKLENSAKMIADQSSKTKINHNELLEDIISVQEKANGLFEKIDIYSEILLKQNKEFKDQYVSTLRNLHEINETVHTLVNLVGGTRQVLEERLSWVMTALGGTDEAVERLYLVLWHIGLILLSMLACAFLSARASTRLIAITVPVANLTMALYGKDHFTFINLVSWIAGLITAQIFIFWAMSFRKTRLQAIGWTQSKTNPTTSDISSISTRSSSASTNSRYLEVNRNTTQLFTNQEELEHNETDYYDDNFSPITPPISRNGHYSRIRSRSRSNTPLLLNSSSRCGAKTRAGTPCKLSSLPEKQFCYKHQGGDSIMG